MTLLRRHGLKMYGTNLLGSFIASTVSYILVFFVYIVFMVLFGVGAIAFGFVYGMSNSDQLGIVGSIILGIIMVLLYLVMYIVAFLPYAFTISGSYSMVTEAVWKDRFRFATYFKHGFSKIKAVIGQMFLLGLLFIPFLLLPITSLLLSGVGMGFAMVDGAALNPNHIGIGMIILFTLSWIPFALFTLSVIYAPVILIAEDRGPWQSIKDSIRLSFRRFGRVLSTALIAFGYGLIPMLPFLLIFPIVILSQDNDVMAIIGVIAMLLFTMFSFLLYPFIQIAFQVTAVRWYKAYLRKHVVADDNDPGPWGDNGIYGFDTFDHNQGYSQPTSSPETGTEPKQPQAFPPFPGETR